MEDSTAERIHYNDSFFSPCRPLAPRSSEWDSPHQSAAAARYDCVGIDATVLASATAWASPQGEAFVPFFPMEDSTKGRINHNYSLFIIHSSLKRRKATFPHPLSFITWFFFRSSSTLACSSAFKNFMPLSSVWKPSVELSALKKTVRVWSSSLMSCHRL